MILVYTITLGVFPGFLIDLGLNWDSPAAIQIILLTFNVFDCIGKWMFAWKQLGDNWIAPTISLSHMIFAIFVIMVFGSNEVTALKDIPAFTIGFTSMMALTNGYITTALFSLAASRCTDRHKDNAGFLMTFAMNFGLAYGAMCVALGTSPS